MSGKHRNYVPLRTCIACGQRRPKRALIRLVRAPEGVLKLDPRGKEPGRGAYLCPDQECWQAALEQGKIQYALKCQVSADDLRALRAFAASELTGDEAASD